MAAAGRAGALRGPLSPRAVAGHAPARGGGAHVCDRARHPAHGRAVRGARQPDATPPAGAIPGSLGTQQTHRAVRDPRPARGDLPLRHRHRLDQSAGPGEVGHSDPAAAPAPAARRAGGRARIPRYLFKDLDRFERRGKEVRLAVDGMMISIGLILRSSAAPALVSVLADQARCAASRRMGPARSGPPSSFETRAREFDL